MIKYQHVVTGSDFVEWLFSIKWKDEYDEDGNPKSKLAKYEIPPEKWLTKWISVIGTMLIVIGGFSLGLGTAYVPLDSEDFWIKPYLQGISLCILLFGVWIEHALFHRFSKHLFHLHDRVEDLEDIVKKIRN